MKSFFGRGMAQSYAAGRAHIRRLNADRARFTFMEQLFDAVTGQKILPTETEQDFICRIIAETDPRVPAIHPGDANICDSLRRKYEGRLNHQDTKAPSQIIEA